MTCVGTYFYLTLQFMLCDLCKLTYPYGTWSTGVSLRAVHISLLIIFQRAYLNHEILSDNSFKLLRSRSYSHSCASILETAFDICRDYFVIGIHGWIVTYLKNVSLYSLNTRYVVQCHILLTSALGWIMDSCPLSSVCHLSFPIIIQTHDARLRIHACLLTNKFVAIEYGEGNIKRIMT